MRYYSLFSVVVTIVSIFNAAESLPSTFAYEDGKRGGQWSPGKLNENPPRPGDNEGGSVVRASEISCICELDGPPADLLEDLKEYVLSNPHPMFLLSEMADKLHHKFHCDSKCLGIQSRQTEDAIPGQVRRTMLRYLNGAVQNTEPCPPRFNITYYPKRYPRYLVKVDCTDGEGKSRQCSFCSSEGHGSINNKGNCLAYEFGGNNMHYLTQDPRAEGCTLSSDIPTWHRCEVPVTVGCRCSQ